MARGWAEFLKRLRRLAAEGRQEPDAAWTRFEDLASRSERANILKTIVRLGKVLPEGERYRLAAAVTRILAPIEWPPEWAAKRLDFVAALDTLVEETNPEEDSSFFALCSAGRNEELQRVTHLVLFAARDLLRRPCRRDELRTVALLCNTGLSQVLKSYRRSAKRIAAGGMPGSVVDAHTRCRQALAAYAEAASDLNEAAGVVLFEGLHAGIEGEY